VPVVWPDHSAVLLVNANPGQRRSGSEAAFGFTVASDVSLFFRAAYLFGFKPWGSGVQPPELVSVVEGHESLVPGKALDLSCGTGTNCVYLAQHLWDATGIDFVPRH
jgi:hypothetical protein